MAIRKFIENVKPYDGMKKMFFFDSPVADCSITNDLIVATAYHANEYEILYNVNFEYEFVYKTDENREKFQLKVVFFEKREEILKRLGIEIMKKSPPLEQLIVSIKTAIDKNRLVLLHIDLFYQEGRTYYYNVKHGHHAVLVYGYDDERRIIHTIDNTQGYGCYEIDYETVIRYCGGLFEFLGYEQGELYLYEYSHVGSKQEDNKDKVKDVLMRYCKNVMNSYKAWRKSLESIKILQERLDILLQYTSFEEDIATIKYRKVSDCYRIKKLYDYNFFSTLGKEIIEEKMNLILEGWKKIQGIVVYYRIKDKNYNLMTIKVKEILDDIYNNELIFGETLIKEIYQFLNSNGI